MKRIITTAALCLVLSGGYAAQTSIKPGQAWNDTSGKHINAHGGCVQYLDGTYYWFGEDRTGYDSNGISCYTSADLYNWKRVGLVFKASQATDPNTGKCILERPKVIYNEKTGKWVMYIHWENGDGYGEARVCVATADRIDGEYAFVATFRPNNHDSRDQTLFKDSDGKAYHFASTDMNTNMNVALLADDYLAPETSPVTETKILKGLKYEAPAIIKAGDVYFGIFSGCTGWNPNPGHTAYTTEILGNWIPGGNFATDNDAATTYHSQSTYIFPVDGKEGAYVYMGDRWNSGDVGGKSEYVWLPLSLRSGAPTVKWHDSWDLSVFDDCDRFKRPAQLADGMTVRILDKYSDRWISTAGNGFYIDDDNDKTNLDLRLEATDNPYQWRFVNAGDGKYFESVFGALMFSDKSESDTQLWRLELEEDGCYKIQNVRDGKILSVSGAAQLAKTPVFMSAKNASGAQSFGLYVDSRAHDVELADMFGAGYRESNRAAIEEQAQYEEALGMEGLRAPRMYVAYREGEIVVETPVPGQAQIILADAGSGIKAAEINVLLTSGTNSIHLEDSLAPGIYVVTIHTSGGSSIFKVVK